ncbi:transglutaminase domain-containing protein [Bacillus tianshenii]|nr:transglutaminase domain-containing protein [Bacillus tianshenii]
MKKIILILGLICSITVWGTGNVSAEQLPKIEGQWSNKLGGKINLEAKQKSTILEIYDASNEEELKERIREGFETRQNSFTVMYTGDMSDLKIKIDTAIEQTLLENEYLSYDVRGYSYSGSGTTASYSINFTANYYQSAQQIEYVRERIPVILDEIITPGMNTHEKVKAVHDYIVLNVAYDESYNQGVNAPYFALTGGETLCNGYAMLVYDMLKELQIPVRLISGTAGDIGHAWNLVQLDGEWYHLDATWDDPVPDEKGRTLYNYYMLTDEMIAEDHHWVEGGLNGGEKPYPTADADYVAALEENGYDTLAKSLELHLQTSEYTVSTKAELTAFILKHFQQMEDEFSVRFVGDVTENAVKEILLEAIDDARSQSEAENLYYGIDAYSRTDETDYVLTLLDIEYSDAITVTSLDMLMLPTEPLEVGTNVPLLVSATLSNGLQKDITNDAAFTISNPEVVSVKNGELISLSGGTATITVTYQNHETTFTVQVEEAPEELTYPIEGYKHFATYTDVEASKEWTVKFNTDMHSYLSDSEVYVLDRFGNKQINWMYYEDPQTLKVDAPTGGYENGETYYLVIEKSLRSAQEKNLVEAVTMKFTIVD